MAQSVSMASSASRRRHDIEADLRRAEKHRLNLLLFATVLLPMLLLHGYYFDACWCVLDERRCRFAVSWRTVYRASSERNNPSMDIEFAT